MAKVTYEYLYGTMPLDLTYAQLQMADQSFRFVDGIAKNVPVHIDDHFIPTDFLVIDMGEDEYDPLIILGRPFLSTTKVIIYIAIGEVHFQFPLEKVRRYFNNNYIVDEEPKKNTEPEEGTVTAPRRIRSPRMDGLTMKERYRDMKIDFLKTIHLLREKLYHDEGTLIVWKIA
jgi:hypothetical protein